MSSSPFDLLSTEVVQDIFLSCLPKDNQTSLPPRTKNSYVIQLVISQVSSRWRLIALNTPQLWDSHFDLSVYDNRPHQAESALRFASMWLRRLGSLPITLKVYTDLPRDNHHIQDFYRLISSRRFKSLAGNLELFCLPLRNKSYEESFTTLETLHLNIPKEFSSDTSHPGQSPDGGNQCQLPSLRTLNIQFRSTSMTWKTILPKIPWHQLTKLTLDDILQATMIEIMRECKALVECNLFIVPASNEGIGSPSESTSLCHLRNLRLASFFPFSDLLKLLLTFNVGNLTSMHIMFPGGLHMASHFEAELLSSQLYAPLQQLEEFILDDPHHVNVRTFLRRMPSLRRLELHGGVSLDDVTAKQISNGELGPHIDTILFRSCRSVKRLLDMIEKRQENASGRILAPFIHVTFGCPGDWHDKHKERVERLEHQYNVQIQMNSMLQMFGDDDSEEKH